MAYPTGMLSLTLEEIDQRLLSLKRFVQQLRAASATGNILAQDILGCYTFLKRERAFLVTRAAVSGLSAYAQAQKNQPGLDVVAEFNTVIATLDAVTGWMASNFPQDGNGFLLSHSFGPDGLVDRQFTPAQTAGLRTQLDTVLAAIA